MVADHFNVTIPSVTLHETELPVVAALMGKANAVEISINGVTYEPRTILFVTFAGAATRDDHDVYKGELRFATGDYTEGGPNGFADLHELLEHA